ncbi:MAG: hypothetical protein HUU55_07265 [Myxococcales bacterium]|nr:hypothetical protein [Myxococcales bacterium]
MRKYLSSAGTDTRVEYGIDLGEGLRSFEQTEDLAAEVDTKTDLLDEAANEKRKLSSPLAKARAKVRINSYHADNLIRQVGADAELKDGGRRGSIFGYVFENGLTEATDPHGEQQLPALKKVAAKLAASDRDDIKPFAAEWLPKIEKRVASFSAAVDALETLRKQYNQLFEIEKARRNEHALMVDKMAGAVRSRFPNDRARQNAVFPTPPTPKKKKNLE